MKLAIESANLCFGRNYQALQFYCWFSRCVEPAMTPLLFFYDIKLSFSRFQAFREVFTI